MNRTLLHPQARLVDAASGRRFHGSALRAMVDAAAGAYARFPSGVVLALMPIDVPAVTRYLGALIAHRPVRAATTPGRARRHPPPGTRPAARPAPR